MDAHGRFMDRFKAYRPLMSKIKQVRYASIHALGQAASLSTACPSGV